ncbi:MAG: hypothetical protein MUF64_21015 [Polyangiaceae bacterium]|jgi:hypothetical protein|nr:hypothetical protein [Polyangiaceae bacterium]
MTSPRHKIGFFTIVAAVTTVATVAIANNFPAIKPVTSAVHKTGVSGRTGTEHKLGDGQFFIYALEWSERNDDPCWFRSLGIWRNKDAGWNFSSPEHRVASCTEHPASRKTIYLQDPKTATSSSRFIRSVQVCTSEKKDSYNEKLKGIRVKSARFDPATNTFVSENAIEESYRNNCKNWEPEVTCPEGQAATAIYLQVGQVGKGTNAYNGIALQCASPEPQPPPPPPAQGPVKKPGGFGFGK